MSGKFLLEITVESVGAAIAAERGGADRIELCANLAVGGITPTSQDLQTVRRAVSVPVFSIVRPRAGDFVYSDRDFAKMKSSMEAAREAGMDGVVLGILRSDRTVDVERTKQLVEFAGPMAVTFHRAFDECADLPVALEDVIAAGAGRILTSGGAATVMDGARMVGTLLRRAAGRIVVVPGGGIQPANFRMVRQTTGAREFHSGLGTMIPYGSGDFTALEEAVRQLKLDDERSDASLDRDGNARP